MVTKQEAQTEKPAGHVTLASRYWAPSLDAVKHGVSLQDRRHTVVGANQALSHLLARPLDDILGEKCGTFLYGRPTLPKNSPLSHLPRDQEHCAVQVSPPGLGKTVRVYVDPLLDEGGRFQGYLCTWIDVTADARRLEWYKDVVDSVPAMIHCLDMDGNIIFVNQTETDTLGYSKDDLLTMHWRDLWPQVTKDQVREIERRLLEEGQVDGEGVMATRDGRRIAARGAATLRYRNGEPLYVRGVWQDVSAINQAEGALRQSEQEVTIHSRIAQIFLTVSDQEMYAEVLQVILEAMESKHGVFGYVDEDGAVVCPSMTRDVWQQCQIPEKDIVFPREEWGGIWGRALRGKKALYSNEPGHVPEGHIAMRRSIAAPIIYRRRVIGLIYVANKETDYDEKDRRLLEGIAGHIAPILNARLQRDRHERERRQAEEELREAKEFAEDLIACMQDGFSVLDSRGVHIEVNRALCEMTGFSREELIGVGPPHPYWPPEESEYIESTFEMILRGKFDESEATFMRKDGERFPVIVSPSWIRNEQGDVLTYFGTIKDITDRRRAEEEVRKHRDHLEELVKERTVELTGANERLSREIAERREAEEALRESEERLRTLYESSRDGIATADLDGHITGCNQAYADMLGYSREELLGVRYQDITPSKWDAFNADVVRKIVEQDYSDAFEKEYTRKDGTVFPVSLRCWRIEDEAGRPVGIWSIVRDITERRRAEEALRVSEERFSKAFHASPLAIVIATVSEGRIVDVNEGFLQLMGYGREELIGRTSLEIGMWVDSKGRKRMVQEVLERGSVPDWELRVRTRSGETRLWLGAFVKIELDGVPCLLGMSRDITEHRQAEEALRESEKRFRDVLDVSRDLVYKLNLKARDYDYVSPSVLGLSGFSPEEVLAMGPGGVNERFHPEDRQRLSVPFGKVFHRTVDGGMVAKIEYRWKRKDGEYRWFSDIRALVRDEDGRPVAIVGTVRDTTEQKEAEHTLRESEERFRSIFESVSDCMIYLDTSGRIVEVNEKAAQMFGGSREELVGGQFSTIGVFHATDVPTMDAAFSKVLGGEEATLDLSITNRKGEEIPLECSAALTEGDDQPAGVMVIARDVSERKRVEEQRRQLQEHRRMVRALEQMAATLGHELRNPLGVISNSVYFLANQSGIDDPKVEKHVGIIEQEAASARRVVDDILGFAHVPELLCAEASINTIVERAIGRCQIPASIRVVRRPGVDLPPVVCDEECLERAFIDIITNAVQAMPHGGRLCTRTRVYDDSVAVSFSDSGEGITRKDLPRIFDPMFTTKLRGVGLGLTVVRRTVEQHGGRIDVKSRRGWGTTFTITLPRECRCPDPEERRVGGTSRRG